MLCMHAYYTYLIFFLENIGIAMTLADEASHAKDCLQVALLVGRPYNKLDPIDCRPSQLAYGREHVSPCVHTMSTFRPRYVHKK